MRHTLTLFTDTPFRLEAGAELSPVDVAWESWGPDDAPVILVCHALTGDSHAARHGPDDRPGWWDVMVGPDKALDTKRWRVVCFNVLGGVAGTTGPASLAPDGRPYGERFPLITVGDMVRLQAAALSALGIDTLALAVGGSLGGMQALEWAWRFPERVQAVAAVGATDRLSAMGIGLNAVQREALKLGLAAERPDDGLKIARMVAMLSYRSAVHFEQRFGRRLQPGARWDAPAPAVRFQMESYLSYQGDKLARRFDAWSYMAISRAMDLFDLWANRDPWPAVPVPVHLAGISSDWLFPPEDVEALYDRLIGMGLPATYRLLHSSLGHDAFLTDWPELTAWLSDVLGSVAAVAVRRPPRRRRAVVRAASARG